MLLAAPAYAQTEPPTEPQAEPRPIFLPSAFGPPAPPNPFGFDVRYYSSEPAFEYAVQARPKWVRAGDVFWSQVEPAPGQYNWDVLKPLEQNLQRVRAAGMEPTMIVQRTPSWAQKLPGRLCSPMKPEAIGAFANFMRALAARYATGPMAVNYWEIWNEPEIFPEETADELGTGCWADRSLPYLGGAYYGEVLKQVSPAIKAANPQAVVLGGALLYHHPDDTISRTFLQGIFAAGAGNAIDMLTFHSYSEWSADDVLVKKTLKLRQLLSANGFPNKPLFATEVAVTCKADNTCRPGFFQDQANYAARLYALARALKLEGALWYTLAYTNPGFRFSHLIDVENDKLSPRPSFYAFRNSARLLEGAVYTGPALDKLPLDKMNQVQTLTFRKARSTLHVLWVPKIDFPLLYNVPVPPGVTAICTDHLDDDAPATYYCSDRNKDGMIPRAVNELPQYVEVLD
jgi:hypothetical protein